MQPQINQPSGSKKRFLSIQEQYENQQKMMSLDFSNNLDNAQQQQDQQQQQQQESIQQSGQQQYQQQGDFNMDETNYQNNVAHDLNNMEIRDPDVNAHAHAQILSSLNGNEGNSSSNNHHNNAINGLPSANNLSLQFHQLQPQIQAPVETQVQPQVQMPQLTPQQPTPVHPLPESHQQQIATPQPSKLPVVVTKGKYSLNDFQIIRTLGTGSFGRVHLIRSVHNGRYYAMKVFRKRQVVRAKQIEHTNDERRILSVIQHPFITRMWGTFQDCKSIFMIMDYIEGGELFSLLRRSKNFPNQVAKFYAAEVLLALEYLHSKNIIYRDLKPENILLARSGHIKLTDFGFAKEVETKTYTLCGTPDYIAPEVIAVQPYNKAVDWWSFGILIYEMLSGTTPFYDVSPMKTYENITKCDLKFNNLFFRKDSVDLLVKLITKDVTYRLGNLQNGVDDIKNHEWFKEVIWDNLLQGNIETPYEPNIPTGVGDSSQFEIYPEENYDYGITGTTDEFGYLFPEF